jgi:hypothetical protein
MECPYINSDFSECSQTLNMQNLSGAYELCTDQYQFCPIYLRLRGQRQAQTIPQSLPGQELVLNHNNSNRL